MDWGTRSEKKKKKQRPKWEAQNIILDKKLPLQMLKSRETKIPRPECQELYIHTHKEG